MTPSRRDHERTDADVGAVVRFGLGVVLLTVATLAAMAAFYRGLDERAPAAAPPPLAGTRAPFTGPRLEVSETAGIEALRAQETAVLTSYAWADRAAGRVRIPIERAMELLARDGRLGPSEGRAP